ncbi:hypothetical protein ULF88_25750 [Halopseudomonas pachastrellae]|nr:hypothetical protein [Halopseudomonas pachastrellae]
MSDTKDTLHRIKLMIALVPKEPGDISTRELLCALKNEGFNVSNALFSVIWKSHPTPSPFTNPLGPSSALESKKNAPMDTDIMLPATALALHLAESHLSRLLPSTVLQRLTAQFELARHQLLSNTSNTFHNWARTVRALPNGKALLPADISSNVWEAVSDALLRERQLRVVYQAREQSAPREHVLHPAGLVSRHAISYLIARTKATSSQCSLRCTV